MILSMRLSYQLVNGPTGFFLWVDADQADAIYEQLAKYQRESKRWPPRPLAALVRDRPAAPLSLAAFAVLMIAFFAAQKFWPRQLEDLGAMNNEALLDGGQWFRAVTALTLHADIGHLVGNLVSGLCFGLLINRVLGAGLGWTLVVLAGALGNAATGWFYWPEIHLSLGASTAIFGALGLLVGHALAGRFSPAETTTLRQRAIPLAAGVVVLLLTGFGTGKVDVMAHVFGFAIGVPLGALGFAINTRWPTLTVGRTLLAAPLALVFAAWIAALIAAR